MNAENRFHAVLFALTICMAIIPITAFLTVLLTPLWERLELVSGIVAKTADWPAAWCFMLVYILLGSLIALFWHSSLDS